MALLFSLIFVEQLEDSIYALILLYLWHRFKSNDLLLFVAFYVGFLISCTGACVLSPYESCFVLDEHGVVSVVRLA